MISFRFDEALIKRRQLAVDLFQPRSQYLKFFTTPSLEQAAADQVVDCLMSLTVADRSHQSADPFARPGLAEGNAPALEQVQHELEVLQLLDRYRVQFPDAREQVAIFFEVQCGRG